MSAAGSGKSPNRENLRQAQFGIAEESQSRTIKFAAIFITNIAAVFLFRNRYCASSELVRRFAAMMMIVSPVMAKP